MIPGNLTKQTQQIKPIIQMQQHRWMQHHKRHSSCVWNRDWVEKGSLSMTISTMDNRYLLLCSPVYPRLQQSGWHVRLKQASNRAICNVSKNELWRDFWGSLWSGWREPKCVPGVGYIPALLLQTSQDAAGLNRVCREKEGADQVSQRFLTWLEWTKT